MRLIKMTGGLGNQMFIYAFYMDMKRRFPKTYIDLSDMVHYNAHNGYELNKVFNIVSDEFCINQGLKKAMEFCFFKTIIERKQNLQTLEVYRRSFCWPLIYFKGFYQSERYFSDIIPDIRKTFQFDVQKANLQTRSLANTITDDSHAVAIHVRRGDYLYPKFLKSVGGVCSLEYYTRAIHRMQDIDAKAHFYVFSDDTEWCKMHLPVNNHTVYVDWNKGKDSWQDMMLMSMCKNNIICNSTFSWWGAWLNSNKNKIVLTPDRWSLVNDTPYINCTNWIEISTK